MRILVAGDPGSGKTLLISNLADNLFPEIVTIPPGCKVVELCNLASAEVPNHQLYVETLLRDQLVFGEYRFVEHYSRNATDVMKSLADIVIENGDFNYKQRFFTIKKHPNPDFVGTIYKYTIDRNDGMVIDPNGYGRMD